ncbi:melanotransferrin isoform X2 [Zootermopsis nevadensis]|uniref:Melanotransferrin n=1 Tax=Zootermopsis nevadensis TaxID=136037 RepID=A0A067RD61_ZOONE|nr:melanotransferrin isoform X1 [Zootermopsis nevadensis]XP_021922860.1 melanotransferrin isoform X2 [Zootermopsis nevadensis]KDR17893.1 Melanotransferrin [Zootermopsis nevadensis]
MEFKFAYVFLSVVFLFLCLISNCEGQQNAEDSNRIVWCTISSEEQRKCLNFAQAVERDWNLFGTAAMRLDCKQGFNKEDCMTYLDEEKAHITSLDAGEVFVAGRYHSLIPIMQEVYSGNQRSYYAVAVIRKGTLPDVQTLHDLRGKKACFAGVGTLAGWVIPVYKLMQKGGMDVIDCNNHVKSAIKYFGPSCAVNSLIDKYNPIGDNSDKLCKLCIGKIPGDWCSSADPYFGFEGAFRCLVETGEIAFLKHTTVDEMTSNRFDFSGVSKLDFELLCQDGSRKPVDEYQSCYWDIVPTHAVVTTSAKSTELRKSYQRFLKKAIDMYGTVNRTFTQNFQNDSFSSVPVMPYESFNLFESAPRYGLHHNLLFQDVAITLSPLSESQQTYAGYLGKSLNTILGVRHCPVNKMTLCVTSDPELEKCVKMRTALKAQLLKPEMVCHKGHSQINCMQAISNGIADVAVFDAGDVYTAGLKYDLIPFISEVYNLGEPEYYAVAVAKEEDPDTELTYLKGKYTCHTGINTGAGWIVPLAFLISNGWIRSYGCNSVRAAAEYFTKSCVPGALSSEYNTGVPYDNMCDLCHGISYRYCRRDASEDYYGYTGAFRCLVEGGGQVAFLKHTTVMENTDGKRKEWWARNTLTDDYELLCPDGTRAAMQEYEKCNLGKIKANAIVARGGNGYNETELNAFINLFIYAQQFYGRKDQDDFSFGMFYSPPPYSDLIFQDAAQQLQVIDSAHRSYGSYLGKDFLRARRVVDCHAGATVFKLSILGIFVSTGLSVLVL